MGGGHAAPSRWCLPSVVPPHLGHVPSPEAVTVLCQPVGQPRSAGRRFDGREQPSHQAVNLVAGERHVAHQQADQPGQVEAHRRGRAQESASHAHRGRQQAKQGLEGERVRPRSVGDGALALRAIRNRLGRKVFNVDGLHLVVAAPADGKYREAPKRPGDVVEQQVALAEHQGGPDDGVGDSEALQHILDLHLALEVGKPGP